MKRPAKYIVRSAAQLRVIATPVRQEIVTILEEMQEFSVRELAEHLGRPVESVYYHVHQLVKAGLVDEVGTRAGTTRREALYRLVADRLFVDRKNCSRAYREVLKKSARGVSHFANRLLQSAFDHPDCEMSGAAANFQLRQRSARLSRARLRQLAEMLAEVDRFLLTNNDPRQPTSYVVTTTYAPVLRGS